MMNSIDGIFIRHTEDQNCTPATAPQSLLIAVIKYSNRYLIIQKLVAIISMDEFNQKLEIVR